MAWLPAVHLGGRIQLAKIQRCGDLEPSAGCGREGGGRAMRSALEGFRNVFSYPETRAYRVAHFDSLGGQSFP